MNQRKKPIQTGLELKVKPVSDRGMTEEEYRAKVAELKKEAQIKKQQEAQDALNKVAEQHVAQRRLRGPVQRPQQRRGIPRRVIPRPEPIRGLLHPEEVTRPAGFMGLLFDGVKK